MKKSQFYINCATIARMTDENDHTGAVVALAYLLKLPHFVKIAKHIQGIHKLEGHIPLYLHEYRAELRKRLFALAARQLTPDQYAQLINSF